MILLENANLCISTVLTERFTKASRFDVAFVDFDNVRFHLSTPTSKTQILLSMAIQCWPDLVKYGAEEVLEWEFGDWIVKGEGKEQEYDVSLLLDLEKIPEDAESRQALITHFSMLKPTLLSAPFHVAFSESSQLAKAHSATVVQGGTQGDQPAEAKGELMIIKYREEEAIYVQSSFDRVTVVFSTVFREETDRVFGKVFLQEFVDARRLPSIQNAPQVLYSNRGEPPLEIRHIKGLKNGEDVGYVTFVLFPRHFATPEIALSTILRLQLFRDFLHYHIKCSKAFMHSRMRSRVAEFQKILNRAKPEVVATEKKTASGRTFRTR